MTVIKKAEFDNLPKRPTDRILRGGDDASAWRDGFAFLTAAREVQDAERARGYAEGRAEGLTSAAEIITRTTLGADAFLSEASGQIADLAVDIARRVLGEMAPQERIAKAAAHAIGDFRRERTLRMAVHPESLEAVRKAVTDRLAEAGADMQIQFETDPGLARDTCIVRSAFAEVEISIEAQLACIAKALRNGYGA